VVGALMGGLAAPIAATSCPSIEPPLRAVEVCACMGWSLATLRRRMRDGEFPEPAFGRGGVRRRILLWRVSDIREFIESGGVGRKRGAGSRRK
jgi:predicted DNA-binding transcriptional regulator AlpA